MEAAATTTDLATKGGHPSHQPWSSQGHCEAREAHGQEKMGVKDKLDGLGQSRQVPKGLVQHKNIY